MRYLLLVGSEGLAAPQEVAVMQREIPGWTAEMERRGVLLLGRPLDPPQTAATVRVRDGETLVTDGPFAETKEFIAGFDLVECADLDEAIEVAAKGPVSWFKTIEIRTLAGGPWLGAGAAAFGRGEDGAARRSGGDAGGQGLAAEPAGTRPPHPGSGAGGPGHSHDAPRPRREDAARRRDVHQDRGVHHRHRRHQLR